MELPEDQQESIDVPSIVCGMSSFNQYWLTMQHRNYRKVLQITEVYKAWFMEKVMVDGSQAEINLAFGDFFQSLQVRSVSEVSVKITFQQF